MPRLAEKSSVAGGPIPTQPPIPLADGKNGINALVDVVFQDSQVIDTKLVKNGQDALKKSYFPTSRILNGIFGNLDLECCRRDTPELDACRTLNCEIGALRRRRDAAIELVDKVETIVVKMNDMIVDRNKQLTEMLSRTRQVAGVSPISAFLGDSGDQMVDESLAAESDFIFESRAALLSRWSEADMELKELRQEVALLRKGPGYEALGNRSSEAIRVNGSSIAKYVLHFCFDKTSRAMLRVLLSGWRQCLSLRTVLRCPVVEKFLHHSNRAFMLVIWRRWQRDLRASRLLTSGCSGFAQDSHPLMIVFGLWKTRVLQLWRREAQGYAQRCDMLHNHAVRCNKMTKKFADKLFDLDAWLSRVMFQEWWKGVSMLVRERLSEAEPKHSAGTDGRAPETDAETHTQLLHDKDVHSGSSEAKRSCLRGFCRRSPKTVP